MPEVLYGFNRLYITKPSKDVLLEFSPIEALSLSAYAKQNYLYKQNKESSDQQPPAKSLNLNMTKDEVPLNQIDIIPEKIEVKDSHIWKKKDMS